VKIAFVGGGGFRTPLVFDALRTAVPNAELVLQDVSNDRLERVASVIRGLEAERGGVFVRTTVSLEEAVGGASFVLCAVRVGGLAGRIVDEAVPLELGVLGQETVGPGGIAFALRTVPVMDGIAQVVGRLAPQAWFVNFTNPAGLVTEALGDVLGERVVGICDSPTALCARVAAAVGRPMRSLGFDYSGLNHLGWLRGVFEGDRDLLPGLLQDDARLTAVEEARLFGVERIRALGMIPNEYLLYYERGPDVASVMAREGSRGRLLASQQRAFYEGSFASDEEALAVWRAVKDQRHGTYMAEAWSVAGGRDFGAHEPLVDEGPGETGYGAIAAGFIRSIAGQGDQTLVLNASNAGRTAFLDDEAVIEAPCRISENGVEPLPVGPLPPDQRELVARVKEVERMTIRAARTGSAALALNAIAAHPVVPSRDVASRILSGYLERQPGLREQLR